MNPQKIEPKEVADFFTLRDIIERRFSSDKRKISGRIFTIIDAAIENEDQKEKLKNLIEDAIWRDHSTVNSYLENALIAFANEYCPENTPRTDEQLSSFKRNQTKEALDRTGLSSKFGKKSS